MCMVSSGRKKRGRHRQLWEEDKERKHKSGVRKNSRGAEKKREGERRKNLKMRLSTLL